MGDVDELNSSIGLLLSEKLPASVREALAADGAAARAFARRLVQHRDAARERLHGEAAVVAGAHFAPARGVAARAGKMWMEFGALSYVECVGEDVPYGELTSFPRAVQATDDEVVIFSWVVYEDKAARDEIMAKVMADERMKGTIETMPFDGKRMIFGGFQPFIRAGGVAGPTIRFNGCDVADGGCAISSVSRRALQLVDLDLVNPGSSDGLFTLPPEPPVLLPFAKGKRAIIPSSMATGMGWRARQSDRLRRSVFDFAH